MQTIPEPPDVSLVDEVDGFFGGSDERCYGAYVDRLYGTESAFDDVLMFYEESMSSDGWQRDRTASGPVWMSSTRHFLLSVYSEVDASRIPSESIETAQKQFPTLYGLALTYMVDPSCWQI